MVLELTTAAKVKLMLGGLSGTSQDALIADLVAEVSQEAEEYLRRHTLSAQRVEVYELPANKRYLSLNGFPISGNRSVGVQYATTRDFTDVDSLDSSSYQLLIAEGQLDFDALYHPDDGFAQVNYVGGMAADTAGFMSAYPRIAGAVAREIVNRLNRAKAPEGSLKLSAASMGYEKPLESLKDFYAALDHHRRIVP